MRSYFVRRLLLLIPTLIGISLISFLIIHLSPGDPASLKLGNGETGRDQAVAGQIIAETRALYGLDQPLYVQYGRWLRRMLTFDFGESLEDHEPIIGKLRERIPVSMLLSGLSLFFAYLIAIPLGIYSSTHSGSIGDRVITFALFALYSLPNFWIATMAIVYLGGGDFWKVFPVFGLHSAGVGDWPLVERFKDYVWHLILPVACMTYYTFAALSRYMRASMLETVRQDFIRTARAKGLNERVVVYRHALRNSLIPIVTLMADLLPALIGGSIVIELLFSIPGMGQLSYQAVLHRDYPLIMAVFTVSAVMTLIGILLADLLYIVVDPRIAYEKRAGA